MVFRLYVEKKKDVAVESAALLSDVRGFLGIENLTGVRILNRYDVENIPADVFEACKYTVFAEPQLDIITDEIMAPADSTVFAVEYFPGQFDQRADSAPQCDQIISKGEKPLVRTAKVYVLEGVLTDTDVHALKQYLINPVESREASLDLPSTLEATYAVPSQVETLTGFTALDEAGLKAFIEKYRLAMDLDDIRFCRDYFVAEQRDPTITEIRMIDTYWSDHCRHTTFLTEIDHVTFADAELEALYQDYLNILKELGRTKPICLMDIATVATRYLKAQGKLPRLDESEEINACTVKFKVHTEQGEEDFLLLFKNETHNHPTEIEPFGGAATCIGGAIRDPLSGRSYAYAAIRVTGAADPTRPVADTIPGKLPQKKIVTTAAAGYSSYGNQIGLATGQVDELYHDGYAAKRMEIGAVVAAAPAKNVRRERPQPGDIVILLGGRTGRDGCGGATGSSKSHTAASLETCGAEVQKGNAPEERKLQRLFRNAQASRMIKRCNDFGAGGVSVAIGELADGLDIDLNAVPKKYEGLDGTELAISESQERMAVVVEPCDVERFVALAGEENLEATVVATVQAQPRLTMHWNSQQIVNLSREFLNSNGAPKHIDIAPAAPSAFDKETPADFVGGMAALVQDLNVCSKQGLSERFDSTVGAGTVLMPFGGKYQRTPIQAMVNKISLEHGDTDTCSLMAWGGNPYILEKDPASGAYLAVVESISKLIAAGASFEDVYLSFQEYFEKPGRDEKRWGKPLAALLGALRAQLDFSVASIGGKDSMSGTFEDMDVPPTLVSFAATTDKMKNILSPEFKQTGSTVLWLRPSYDDKGIPHAKDVLEIFNLIASLAENGRICCAYTLGFGGVAEAVFKMAIGNGIGFSYADSVSMEELFAYRYGSFIVELSDGEIESPYATLLGKTTTESAIIFAGETVSLEALIEKYEGRLEEVFPKNANQPAEKVDAYNFTATTWKKPCVSVPRPTMLIPVFPGTNCEYESAKAVENAGGNAEILVINNLSAQGIAASVEAFAAATRQAQGIFIPGGFSGGDEPDGSGKFITAFFRSAAVREAVSELLEKRDGLMLGICNGFQALIKLGLVPFGKIIDTDDTCPTLTYNIIGRHQSMLVRTRVASNASPWLMKTKPGDVYTVPISHGEGRFVASEELIGRLAENGQIATQYVDLAGNPMMTTPENPNGSVCAIEGITSPDGRVLGKMGHSERIGSGLYKNVPGDYDMHLFDAFVEYYK